MSHPWPPLEQLLPHRPPMLLLDAVERFDGAVIACRVTPRVGGLFVRDGFAPALVSVEYFAQAAAAFYGVGHYRSGGAMRMGVLLGARELRLEVDRFPVDAPMTVLARQVWTDGRVAQFDCELRGAGEDAPVLARASINVQSDPVDAGLIAGALAPTLGGEAS